MAHLPPRRRRGFPWYRAGRLALVGIVLAIAGVVLLPYSVGDGVSAPQRTCIALRDGWRAEPPKPTNAEANRAVAHLFMNTVPPGTSRAVAQAWAARELAWSRTAVPRKIERYGDWLVHGGACVVDGGRDRLRFASLGSAVAMATGLMLWISRRRSRPELSTVTPDVATPDREPADSRTG